jgi:NAD(P)-dependent dehydrogenase (short-subunit alcohol dehydrogenase family)
MSYFVTGATGFIGRNLVELLLEREGTINVLVREGSRGRLEELINRWDADEGRIVPVVGDLSQRYLGVSGEDIDRMQGEVEHFFHLAAIYDMKADAASQRVANVEGTRHAVQLAERIDAAHFHMVSSIAAAGLYKGTWREDMFEEAQEVDNHPYFQTKHESERVVREECEVPWRVYRPGIVVGNSETGEMDKVDGPYYFFKLIRRIRQAVPSWAPMPGVEGREINIVPVDFVAKAMDHIAHEDGLDGRAFSLTDPDPLTAGEVIDVFARAAHAPEATLHAPPELTESLEPLLELGVKALPFADTITDAVLADFGIPREVLVYLHYPSHFDSRNTQAALEGTGITVPPLESYADKLWDYWSRHLDPDLYRDRTLLGAMRGRAGLVGGLSQIIGQQIPDELVRAGKKLLGTASLEKNVDGRVVMVTGASSGIGKATAMKIAEAGGIVLLVARTPSKLEETRDAIVNGGGQAYVHPCDLSDMEDIDRMCEGALEQHGRVDVLINNAGRSIRRSIALSYDRFHDFERTMQLNYFGPVRTILRLLPTMREERSGQIINVSSIGVQTNMPRFSAYVASKSALDAFSRCIASEIVDDGVHITTVHMPLVRTPMIAPTRMYDRFPTITPDEAADMLCDAIVYEPKRIATPVGTLGQILYAINPKSMDYILNSAYHMFPDSTAAKKGKKTVKKDGGGGEDFSPERYPEDEQATAQQIAFAYLMRGVHW